MFDLENHDNTVDWIQAERLSYWTDRIEILYFVRPAHSSFGDGSTIYTLKIRIKFENVTFYYSVQTPNLKSLN